jgi:hypothetical protein
MSLFDPNIIPAECGTPDYIDAVNKVVELLRARKVLSISLVGVERTCNLVRSYIQAHIRRCLTFIEGGHAEFYSGRSLVADACIRANYENVAAFCDFAKNLIRLLEAGDNAAIREFVEIRAFATRIEDAPLTGAVRQKETWRLGETEECGTSLRLGRRNLSGLRFDFKVSCRCQHYAALYFTVSSHHKYIGGADRDCLARLQYTSTSHQLLPLRTACHFGCVIESSAGPAAWKARNTRRCCSDVPYHTDN